MQNCINCIYCINIQCNQCQCNRLPIYLVCLYFQNGHPALLEKKCCVGLEKAAMFYVMPNWLYARARFLKKYVVPTYTYSTYLYDRATGYYFLHAFHERGTYYFPMKISELIFSVFLGLTQQWHQHYIITLFDSLNTSKICFLQSIMA